MDSWKYTSNYEASQRKAYQVTISPDPERILKRRKSIRYSHLIPMDQRGYIIEAINELMEHVSKYIVDNEFHFEMSGNGNIHSHGVLYFHPDVPKITTKLVTITKFLNGVLGRKGYNLKTKNPCTLLVEGLNSSNENYDNWLEYIQKEDALPKYVYTNKRKFYSIEQYLQ